MLPNDLAALPGHRHQARKQAAMDKVEYACANNGHFTVSEFDLAYEDYTMEDRWERKAIAARMGWLVGG